MSTALNHIAGAPVALLSGNDANSDDYARMLEEQFGPARAKGDEVKRTAKRAGFDL
jgi:hypothetical protein